MPFNEHPYWHISFKNYTLNSPSCTLSHLAALFTNSIKAHRIRLEEFLGDIFKALSNLSLHVCF